MAETLTSFELVALSMERMIDADSLLNANRWHGAFYVAGYAIEFGIKAAIARNIKTILHDFQTHVQVGEFTTQTGPTFKAHKPVDLMKAAGWSEKLEQQRVADQYFARDWQLAKDWGVEVRYEPVANITPERARDMVAAVRGVMPWIWRL